jgi:hypothetical protein
VLEQLEAHVHHDALAYVGDEHRLEELQHEHAQQRADVQEHQ